MKKTLFTLFMLLVAVSVVSAQTIPVTFKAKLGARVHNGLFDMAKDSLTVRGDLQVDAGAPSDWGGFFFKMKLNAADTTYSVTLNLPAAGAGTKMYNYKFAQGPDTWENVAGGGNRSFTLGTSAQALPGYWFNDDSTYNTVAAVTNTFNFTADLSGILGSGVGYFDPTIDSIQVVGLDWDGHGTFVSGNRTMVADPLVVGLYTASGLVVKGMPGDSARWKFKGYPDARFANSGYEAGGNRLLAFGKDGATIDVNGGVPAISPAKPPLTADLTVLVECNVVGAKNAKTGKLIPQDSIMFVGIKGGNAPLGSWGGSWLLSDTVTPNPTMIRLYDDGTHGDKVKGDKVYSANILFPSGTATGPVEFKFGIWYPAASADAGGTTPLDNEGVFGQNHILKLTASGPTHIKNNFGDFISAVKDVKSANVTKFELNQNYPNPFNPTTNIKFSVPVDGNVVMKIYNVMGQEVATLVNEYVKAGAKEVTFNASSMPSGMYVYSIKAGSFSATKKMMLLK